MNPKYADVIRDVEAVFGGTGWTTLNVPAFPSNYEVSASARENREFVIIEVLPGAQFTNYARPGLKGQIIIQIYTESGLGVSRAYAIADQLDKLLQTTELTRGTLTSTSSMAIIGVDSTDEYLFRTDYTVNFTKY
jgi:hypothetical protein